MSGAAGKLGVRRIGEAPNAALIGSTDARRRLLTPALLVDLDILDANIARMQALCTQAGVALRPHGKAHKCIAIARRQLEAGATGICVATPGEAAIFAEAGIADILLTSTFAPGPSLERVADTAARCRLSVVVDAVATADALGAAASARGIRIPVLIDLDMGRHRSGVEGFEPVERLAGAIGAQPSLELAGLQAYAGHLSHQVDPAARTAGAAEAAERIRTALRAIETAMRGRRTVVTGGSTGAFHQELACGLYTEFQCGSYTLMDAEYDLVDPDGGGMPAYPTSLFVAVRVTSANHVGLATTDGGEKRFVAKHATLPRIVRGAPPGATYRPTSDEHGTVILPAGTTMKPGDLIELQVPHCDPTVNLYDFVHVVRADELIDIWPVDARGA